MTRLPAITMLVLALTMAAGGQRDESKGLLATVDHLVYTTPDLDRGVEAIAKLVGVRATAGGQHPGLGTRNALIALGPATYLEIIGPDPEQVKPSGPRRFGIDDLQEPRLLTWVAKGAGLEQFTAAAAHKGINLGTVIPGSRQRPDGVLLSWRYTDPNVVLADRLVPYFIDWGHSPHPALTAPKGATLVGLRAEHPNAPHVQTLLGQLGLDLQVRSGPKAALIATIDGPKGRIELRD